MYDKIYFYFAVWAILNMNFVNIVVNVIRHDDDGQSLSNLSLNELKGMGLV